jgi:hypothetical protein
LYHFSIKLDLCRIIFAADWQTCTEVKTLIREI